jgi:hypothetical protein
LIGTAVWQRRELVPSDPGETDDERCLFRNVKRKRRVSARHGEIAALVLTGVERWKINHGELSPWRLTPELSGHINREAIDWSA